jgi:hypothetical protein
MCRIEAVTRAVARLLAFVAAASAVAVAQGAPVVVRPAPIDDVLVNPGMGITTFQRVNGQPLNPPFSWSEEGPTAPPGAPTHPDFPVASIAYYRWFWATLEPAPGAVRWDVIDTALEQARAHGQTLAIRLMPYDPTHPLPGWYRASGARRVNQPAEKDDVWEPDVGDPRYLQAWGRLVAAAGARYDGHPTLESVDISTIGHWGEGWTRPMPAFVHQKALIDIYFDAFPRTPLLVNFDAPRALSYATGRGAGWRLDCLGDMGLKSPRWSHMLDFYPQQVVRAGIQDVWRRRPVALETCAVPATWRARGFDVQYILEQALRWHVSVLNVKSSPIPPEWKTPFDDFQRKMGYRFVLRRLEYPGTVRAGRSMPLQMWWLNAGVAPVYREYWLAVELSAPGGRAVMRLDVDVRRWQPGDALFEGVARVPETLAPGPHRLRLALLDPRTGLPAIRLAIQGREPDGWYGLGTVTVE